MKITLVKINTLNIAEYNPRQISNKQYEDLKKAQAYLNKLIKENE